jgi:DNA-binding transcriptional regulator GbsR (MarR family)
MLRCVSDLAQAVERIGQTLEGAGLPRMAARVFAYVLAEDRDRYTAADLASGLDVSPAAISGAVRYLTQTRLLVKERNPAGRGDLFRVVDTDIWGTISAARLPLLDLYVASMDEALAMLEPGSAGYARVEETRDFFAFSRDDLAGLVERWAAYRAARRR